MCWTLILCSPFLSSPLYFNCFDSAAHLASFTVSLFSLVCPFLFACPSKAWTCPCLGTVQAAAHPQPSLSCLSRRWGDMLSATFRRKEATTGSPHWKSSGIWDSCPRTGQGEQEHHMQHWAQFCSQKHEEALKEELWIVRWTFAGTESSLPPPPQSRFA